MGRWAMGIAASDEYQEVKDEFFLQYYYTEKSLEEIEQSILENYRKDYSTFDIDDGVWHDVYFALAHCEWECGNLSKRLLLKVEDIIKNKLNILYMESLSASTQDLEKREKILDDFLLKLNTRKEKPIKRKLKKPHINPFKTGDVFQYRYKGYYYFGMVLQVWDSDEECDIIYKEETLHYCIAISDIKSACPVSVEQIENSKIRCIEWIMLFNLPKRGKFEILGNVSDKLSKDYRDCFGARMTRYGMSLSGRFDDNFLDIISDKNKYSIPLTSYLKRNGILD